ncbi:MAG: ATP-binding protein [Chromatiales bacterium]
MSACSQEANFWLDHLHPDDRQWVPIHSHSMIKVHKDYDFECPMIAADGRVLWLHSSTRVILKEGRVVSLVGVMVADNGQGIDESLRDDIFQPFVTSKEVGQGSGMGLPVVSGIVKSYDGHLLVESTPDRGGSFEILLPEAQHDTQVDEPAQKASGIDIRLDGFKILAVDDEAQFSAFFGELFSGVGAEVVCCRSGVQALQIVERFDKPVSGGELLTAIRRILDRG